jgi:hypothetical protein
MDSISPEAVRTDGDHSDAATARTFLGKLMEQFGLGTTAFATLIRPVRAPVYRRASQRSPGQAT